jgi:hypothetical protein
LLRTIVCLLALGFVTPALSTEPVDLEMVTRIREEGLHRSEVMKTAATLTDVIGPRLTGSPQMKRANEWTRDRLTELGLEEARLESYEFGQGWSFHRAAVHMLEPHELPLIALPRAWSPGTKKAVRGEAMKVKLGSKGDFDEYRGKLKGKILFLSEPRAFEPAAEAAFERYDDSQLAELFEFPIPRERDDSFRKRYLKRWKFRAEKNEFLVEEGVLATVEVSWRGDAMLSVGGTGIYDPEENRGVPSLIMAAEQYNRILRLLEDEERVRLEVDVRADFHTDDLSAYNTVAELRGTDKAGEIVMVGAHLDSWHAGTGASDNAAGCAVAIEAVRILKALDVKPRRTIRVALWSGEEQGLHGSRAYVKDRIATRPESEDPEQLKLPAFLRKEQWPLILEAEHATHSVYFNLDNGSGRIRGIYAEENAAVRPIFEAWLEPLHDLGADTVTLRRTRGTDHMSFDRVGVPGFQFIQDDLDYSSRTHHTNVDVYDHLEADDLKQASVVMASFLYHAAMREEMLPRGPLPREPEEEEEEEEDEEPNEDDGN